MSLFKRRFNPEKELNKIQNGNKKKTLIGIISLLVIIAIGSSFALYQVRNIQDIVYTKVGAFGDIVVSSTLDGSSGYVDKGNYTATVSCTNPGAATWNYKSWGIEISSFASKKTNCFINYTTNSSKTYLNDKVNSLVGNGEVFNEEAVKYNFDNAIKLTQNDYNNVTMYSSKYAHSTSGTVNTNSYSYSGTSWSSMPENLTSGTYYHIKFNIPSDGYYQFCYTISTGNYINRLYLYNGTKDLDLGGGYVSASSSTEKSGCQDIGFITTSDDLRVIQQASTPIATVSFYLQKSNNTETVNAGIRYEGMNPNNYVWFNNEMWRIIGVFDDTTHGVTGESLVKIIREKSLGGLAWDKSRRNNWATSSLMNLLNGSYLNQQDGTNSNFCYGYVTTNQSHCDYRIKGISDDYRSMIETKVIWKLGGSALLDNTASGFYTAERGTTTYKGNATIWPNSSEKSYPVGLMYMSDYGYAVPATNCSRAYNLASYRDNNCTLYNWMLSEGDEWTLTHYPIRSFSPFMIVGNGYISAGDGSGNFAGVGYSVRPVLYLKSSALVISGDGSEATPYIIGM